MYCRLLIWPEYNNVQCTEWSIIIIIIIIIISSECHSNIIVKNFKVATAEAVETESRRNYKLPKTYLQLCSPGTHETVLWQTVAQG